MKYDFTTVYDRRGMDALAVDALGQPGGFAPGKPKDGFSMHALLGAYTTEGREWVDELCEVLSCNVNFACDFITRHFPGVQVAKPEGTYMLFLDCTDWCAAHDKTLEDVLHAGWDVGVPWQDGRMFRHPCAIRMNLALPRALVEEAFNRLSAYVFV